MTLDCVLRRAAGVALVAASFGPFTPMRLPAQEEPGSPATADEAAIRRLIADHYVTAVFVTRDEAAVRKGFHPRFHLLVFDEDSVIVAPLDMWLGRLKLDGVRSSNVMRHEVAFVDVAGDAAVVRAELFEDDRHIYTDYFGLYRFSSDGWRIVTKIFQDRD